MCSKLQMAQPSRCIAEAIGAVSAIVAEYRALLAGLQHAYELGARESRRAQRLRLLVAHLSGERVPINPKLVALGNEILDLTTRIGSVTVSWTPSDANGVAHALVTEALAPRADSIPLHEEAKAPAPPPSSPDIVDPKGLGR